MPDERLAKLFLTQKSLTEWLQDINHHDAEILRQEDNDKRERLSILNQIIGLPFDKPTQFEAVQLEDTNPVFAAFLQNRGNDTCALRLIPKQSGLPKLRMRGKSIKDAHHWFKTLAIEPELYRADFVPHPPDESWSTIFVVNRYGIQGEIIYGGHDQLTQGFHREGATPLAFRYDYQSWSIAPHDPVALDYLQTMTKHLYVPETKTQQTLAKALEATFTHNYLEGYFETTHSTLGTWFIDYSPRLGKLFNEEFIIHKTGGGGILQGQTASPGRAAGPVKIVSSDNLDAPFAKGSILVCEVTTPDYVLLMQKAAAVVTDQGGILSHAAIVARELGVPCVVGTRSATKVLADAQSVLVDADRGIIQSIK